jgi:parallel beta-helix repeat protein
MLRRTFSAVIMALLFLGIITLAFNVKPAQADGQTIYINADGSITPVGAPIVTSNKILYTFSDNISNPITVERSGVVIDGAGTTMHGNGSGTAILLDGINYTTVKNVKVESFGSGIILESCSGCDLLENSVTTEYGNGITLKSCSGCDILENSVTTTTYYGLALYDSSFVSVSENNVTGTSADGIFLDYSFNNSVYNNNLKGCSWAGVRLWESMGNIFYQNSMVNNGEGMFFDTSPYNTVCQNNISANEYMGIYLQGMGSPYICCGSNNFSSNDLVGNKGPGIVFEGSSGNIVWHNNFVDNGPPQVDLSPNCSVQSQNTYDDGYPSGGNYWSDYRTTYPNATEIDSSAVWNAPYVIGSNNTDRYPLMGPFHTFGVGTWNETAYSTDTVSNSSIANVSFDPTAKTLSFNLTRTNGTTGFCRVAIPLSLMSGNWTVKVNGTQLSPPILNITTYGNYTYIYFTYHHNTEPVQITSTSAISESQSFMPLLMVITLLISTVSVLVLIPYSPREETKSSARH